MIILKLLPFTCFVTFPLFHPFQHKGDLLKLRFPNGYGWQIIGRGIYSFVQKQPILVPVMDRPLDQNERFAYSTGPIVRRGVEW